MDFFSFGYDLSEEFEESIISMSDSFVGGMERSKFGNDLRFH
jgi:hypothetical protein